MKKLGIFIVLLFICLTVKSEHLRVGVLNSPPFVMMDVNGGYTGLAIDIWQKIAKDLNLEYQYVPYNGSINSMVDSLQNKKFDLILGSISINTARMDKVDFSQPFYISDLSIASTLTKSSFWVIVSNIFSLTFLKYVLSLFVIVYIIGILIWLVEHKTNPDFNPDPKKGIFEAFYFTSVVMTTVGFGDKSAKPALGRLIVTLWMFISLGITSVFIGNISSTITVNKLDTGVNDISQLNKTKVGTLLNTTSVDFLMDKGVKFIGYDDVQEAITDLTNKNLETFVYDTPILQYYIKKNDLNIAISTSKFDRQYYGIGMNCDDKIESDINKHLIKYLNSELWHMTLAKYNLN